MRVLLLPFLLVATPLCAQDTGSPLIDYAGFRELTSEVQPVRSERLVSLAQFKARAARPNALVLDAPNKETN